jgi:hypothetical protein
MFSPRVICLVSSPFFSLSFSVLLTLPSHDHPKDAEWAKAAAAELYAALLTGDACQTHGRPDRYQELLKK